VRYLLDTTVLIDHAKARHGAVEQVAPLFSEPNELLTCDVVVAGALSAGDDDEAALIGVLLRALEYVSTHPEAARWAAASRRRRGCDGSAIARGRDHRRPRLVQRCNRRDAQSAGLRCPGRPGSRLRLIGSQVGDRTAAAAIQRAYD